MRKALLASSVIVLSLIHAAAAQVAAPRQRPPRMPPGVKVLRDLEYVAGGHERNKLDLYLPEEDPEAARPLVVWIHGGGWQNGSKDRCPLVRLVPQGFVVASINYRLSQHAVFPAQIEDCRAAIRWLRANAAKYHIDPARVGVSGASAGGHLVALLGTSAEMKEWDGVGGNADQSSRVQAVVDLFGPADFTNFRSRRNNPDSIGKPHLKKKAKGETRSPALQTISEE